MLFKKILVVCTGNICRSPLVEALLKDKVSKEVSILSAGIEGLEGEVAHKHVTEILRELDIDISYHRARKITRAMVQNSDLILVMTREQKDEIENMFSFSKGRVFLLGHWNKTEIPDPIGMPIKEFKKIKILIDSAIAGWLPKLS